LTLPVTPEILTIETSNNNETLKTINTRDIKLINKQGLKRITLASFFPSESYSFLQVNHGVDVINYVKIIEKWIDKEIPIRLIIYDDKKELLNCAFAIDEFTYSFTTNKDIEYTMTLEEFVLL
jgi:hypothetical protein